MRSHVLLAASAAFALGLVACDEQPRNPAGVVDAAGGQLSQTGTEVTYAVTHLPSLGGTSSAGNGINNRGLVVGSSTLPGGNGHAALWRNGSVADLSTLGGPHSSVPWPGLTNSGGIIVGISETPALGGEAWSCRFFFPSATGHQCVGFVYEDGEMTPIPTWPGGINGFATEVNSRGQVVGWAQNGVEDPTCNAPVELQFRGFIYDSRTGEMTELTPLPGDSTSTGNAINNRGQVVGISGRCANAVGGFSAQHAVLWQPDGTAIDLGNLGGEAWHTPVDINERGEVVGFGNPEDVPGDAFGIKAWYWSKHTDIVALGTLPGDVSSQALGINNRGQIVGLSDGPNGRSAVIWIDGVAVDLNDLVEPSYTGHLVYAGHINAGGQITGRALDAETGDLVTFIATPIGGGTVD